MTDTLEFIVSRLNAPPFHLNLRLIDFHEKSSLDLIDILIGVIQVIDPNVKTDGIGTDSGAITGNYDKGAQGNLSAIMSFLTMHRYTNMPKSNEEGLLSEWTGRLYSGDREVIHEILFWCFSNYDKLKKRAYLAPFLTPVEIPMDIILSQDNNSLSDLHQRYQNLQSEFKELHKRYETVRGKLRIDTTAGEFNDDGDLTIDEIRSKSEINELQEEKKQLLSRIDIIKEKSRHDESFHTFFKLTSALRKEQDEEMMLHERFTAQREQLSLIEDKLSHLKRRYKPLITMTTSDKLEDLDVMTSQLQNEVTDLTMIVRSDLVREVKLLKNHLKDATNKSKYSDQPYDVASSKYDSVVLESKIKELQDQLAQKKQILENLKESSSSIQKIQMYKQHATVASSQLKTKQSEYEKKEETLQALKDTVEALQRQHAQTDKVENVNKVSNVADVSVEQITTMKEDLDKKKKQKEEIRNEISDLQNEIFILQRTEDILCAKRKLLNEANLAREKSAGVIGYHDIQKQLNKNDKSANDIDGAKGQTLQEISEIVKQMTDVLGKSREKLQPLTKELRDLRNLHKGMQQKYDDKKGKYEKLEMKLSTDRCQLENDCDQMQKEWIQEERNYHYMKNLIEIVNVHLERVGLEEQWRDGEDSFTPEFKTLENLYRNALSQQENMAQQIRKEQKSLKENESENIEQRQLFLQLKKLLQSKLRSKAQNPDQDSKSMDEY